MGCDVIVGKSETVLRVEVRCYKTGKVLHQAYVPLPVGGEDREADGSLRLDVETWTEPKGDAHWR